MYGNENNLHDSNISISFVLKWPNSGCVLHCLFSGWQQFWHRCPLHTETRTASDRSAGTRASVQSTYRGNTRRQTQPESQLAISHTGRTYSGDPQDSIPGPGRSWSRGRCRWWWVARRPGIWANREAARTGHASSPSWQEMKELRRALDRWEMLFNQLNHLYPYLFLNGRGLNQRWVVLKL